MMNLEPIEIPANDVDEEEIPLLEPTEDASEEMKSLFDQILHVLKIHGPGYYMKQVENEIDLSDHKCHASHLGKYYDDNCFNPNCSFQDYAKQVSSKVGGFRPGANSDDILHRVTTGDMGMIEASNRLFTRRQMVYFGW
jgi:hypothetical protein